MKQKYAKKLHLGAVASMLMVTTLSSCSFYPGHTAYTNDDISMGMSKGLLTKQYGKPFSEDMKSENGILKEILCYKEKLSVEGTDYVQFTYFHFEDGKLTNKEQKKEKASDIVIKREKEKEK